jgi:hypothetical protein
MTEFEKPPPTKSTKRGRLKEDLTGEALAAAMQASPRRDVDIEPKRTSMPVRDIDF